MSTAAWPLQVAIVARLDTALEAAGPGGTPVPVLDEVQPTGPFPYVLAGDFDAIDWNFGGTEGEDVTATLHVWSTYRGNKEALDLLGRIKDALNDRPLAVAGHALLRIHCAYSTAYREPQSNLRHGVIRFRARLKRA